MNELFLLIIEIIGTMAFAISGIRLAAAKDFDWFGAYSAGLVTAIGGGTMRDVLLNTTPFWMNSGWYLAVTGLSLGIVIVFKKYLPSGWHCLSSSASRRPSRSASPCGRQSSWAP